MKDNDKIIGKRIKNFEYLSQVAAEERFTTIEEALNEILKPLVVEETIKKEYEYQLCLLSKSQEKS